MTKKQITDSIEFLQSKQKEIKEDLDHLTTLLSNNSENHVVNEVIAIGLELQGIDARLEKLEAMHEG